MKWQRAKSWFAAFGFLFALLNVEAYRHAYRMTHFTDAGIGTKAPGKLTT